MTCPRFEVLIVFTSEVEKDTFSTVIERVERTPFSHTMCVFEDGGRWMLFHSAGNGTVIEPDSDYAGTHHVVRAYRVPMAWPENETKEYFRARVNLRPRYSYWQIFVNQVARIFGGLFGLEISRPLIRNGDASAICVEEMLMLLRGSLQWHRFSHIEQDLIGLKQFEALMAKYFERVPEREDAA